MRALGIDLGASRIGLAVSDPAGILASPLKVLRGSGDRKADRRELLAIAAEVGATVVVIGLPVSLDGREREPARLARIEARALAESSDLEVVTWDERLSTVEASRRLRESGRRAKALRAKIDATAAAVMLQSWLDARRPPDEPDEAGLVAGYGDVRESEKRVETP